MVQLSEARARAIIALLGKDDGQRAVPGSSSRGRDCKQKRGIPVAMHSSRRVEEASRMFNATVMKKDDNLADDSMALRAEQDRQASKKDLP